MTENDRALDPKLGERTAEKPGLRFWCPRHLPWPVAVAVARPVEDDDAIPLRGETYQPTQREILHQSAIAVQEHDRVSASNVQIVQPHPVYIDEAPERWVLPFGTAGAGLNI